MTNKDLLRPRAKELLASLGASYWPEAGSRAAKQLESFGIEHFEALLLYKALPGEISESIFKKTAQQAGLPVYYPRTKGPNMDFVMDDGTPWTRDDTRIPAPPQGNPRWKGGNSLLIAPALAADLRGYRLGHGGGYYDRFLASELGLGLTTMVICADETLWEEPLPHDPWDVPFQWILTPTRLFPVENGSSSE